MRTFIFPGQGSQTKGMGADLFDRFAPLTDIADSILGYSLRRLCLDDPDDRLNDTEFAQPALYVVNALCYLDKLDERGPEPDFVAGHSLGEFNALLAANSFDFETGLRLVKRRGKLMACATGGAMAAILNTSETEVRSILEREDLTAVDIANYNTPSQIVISGRTEDIEAARQAFHDGLHLFVPLKTSGAFHSHYMAQARAEFAEFLERVPLAEPTIPVISNVTARPYQRTTIKKLLTRQISSPVRWTETIDYLARYPGMEFEEIGWGTTLTKLVRKIRREAREPARTSDPRPAASTPADR
ncbi:ACP S-malonyltransferase [Nocardia sp. NBC_01377]|uniref:ACP S-malonyltransferase n=1 Tax=Nocardia sp. NBC_01377 TaxID=2903595 RepID=UPI00324FE4F1